MLNKNNQRELAYLVKVDNVTPMDADRLECAHIGGWHCVVGKGEFQVGDTAVYFEIDSQLPDKEPFSTMEFLRSKQFKIKTQKIRGEYSQGLLMPVSAFGWVIQLDGSIWCPEDGDHGRHYIDDESRFLTEKLGVTYAEHVDNIRKSNGVDKYKKMSARHPKIFKRRWVRWLMKRQWGKELLYFFFGKRRDSKGVWPSWVRKTNEERIQNCSWLLAENKDWVVTEKIDGTSTTFALKDRKFYVCSHNVVFDGPDKNCYYDTNVYLEMAQKYDMKNKMCEALKLRRLLDRNVIGLIVQAETYGKKIQRRDYSRDDHDMAVFNVIWVFKDGSQKRLNPIEGRQYCDCYGLPFVPIIGQISLPNSCDEIIAFAGSEPSKIDGHMREGIVCRSLDGAQSFKAVSPQYLVKYHGKQR